MKKFYKCSLCGEEELFEEDNPGRVCDLCQSSIIQGMMGNIRHGHVMNYEQFLKPGENNPYKDTSCHNRLPGGHFCDLRPGRVKEISVVGCLNCKDRITDNTLSECIKEDEGAIE